MKAQDEANSELLTAGITALESWLHMQPERSRTIYQRRMGDPADRLPLRHLASQLGITAERIRQLQKVLARDLAALSAGGSGPITAMISAINHGAGTLVPETALAQLLGQAERAPGHALAALELAGPYRRKNRWYHRKDAEATNPTAAIRTKVAQKRKMSTAEAEASLLEWGMNPHYIHLWLDSQKEIRREGHLLIKRSPSLADRAYATLHNLATPATIPEIARRISYEGTNKRLQISMKNSGLFSKCSRDKYALREWGRPRYHSLPKAVTEILTEHGGSMKMAHLQHTLLKRHEIPLEWSAARADRTPGTRTANGEISLAPEGPTRAQRRRPHIGPGIFMLSDTRIAILVVIKPRILSGSGAKVSTTITSLMGLQIEKRYYYTLADGSTIHLSHRPKSRSALLGRIRQPLQAQAARAGDIATIILDREAGKAELTLTKQDNLNPSWEQVARLTGINPTTERAGLAKALMCQPEEIEHMLRLRNDWTVLKALP